MPTGRREFLRASALGGAALALGGIRSPLVAGFRDAQAVRRLEVLVLGGTGFIGPDIVRRAVERGHIVTLFNRGRTRPHLFPELEKLRGDRDPDVGEGLNALREREWDVAIDTHSSTPRWTEASATLLADRVGQYVYVSSGAVYADQSVAGITEDAELETLEEDGEAAWHATYGARKALCEKAAREAMGGRATILRPGLITGPGDPAYFRFPWWVARVATRDVIVGPGTPDDPVQLIDSRDLAAFTVQCLEGEILGAFNVVGPQNRLGVGAMIDGLKRGCGTDPRVAWVDGSFLFERDIQMLPWAWPDPSNVGDTTAPVTSGRRYGSGSRARSNARAVAAGLTFRPLEQTVRDVLDWMKRQGLPGERDDIMEFLATRLNPQDVEPAPWFEAEVEDRLLSEWRRRHQRR